MWLIQTTANRNRISAIKIIFHNYMKRMFLPIIIEGRGVYAGFWIRLCAALIDGVLVLPLVFLCIWVGTFNRHTAIMITFFLPVLLVYVICFNAVFGGTAGKLITGIRITKPDGTAIGWSEACLRSSVEIVFGIVMLCIEVWALAEVNGEQYSSISFAQQRQLLQSYYPVWFPLITGLYNIWLLSQPVVLLLNKTKKATHDFIAGTVVIYKDFRKINYVTGWQAKESDGIKRKIGGCGAIHLNV